MKKYTEVITTDKKTVELSYNKSDDIWTVYIVGNEILNVATLMTNAPFHGLTWDHLYSARNFVRKHIRQVS